MKLPSVEQIQAALDRHAASQYMVRANGEVWAKWREWWLARYDYLYAARTDALARRRKERIET